MTNPMPRLNPTAAVAHHLLVFPSGVQPRELAALAASWFPGGDQVDAAPQGAVAVLPETWIFGPWGKPTGLPLPDWVDSIYLVQAPVERTDAVPPELLGRGDLLDAFADGEPVGAERQAVDFMIAAARRLGGGVRVSGHDGLLMTPEGLPDLLLFSQSWLPQADLIDLLAPQVGLTATAPTDAAMPAHAIVDASSMMDEGQRRWLHAEADAFDAAARASSAAPPEQSYGVHGPLPDGSVISIAVEQATVIPPVLGGYTWESPVLYEVRCYPGESEPEGAGELIDSLVVTMLTAIGGRVVDDDGFLV
ncbi:MAG: hypothetical protein ACK5KU_08540 [Beutenbergiaceae bacterium]